MNGIKNHLTDMIRFGHNMYLSKHVSEKVLILVWTQLPNHIKDIFQGSENFGNDRVLPYGGEFDPNSDNETYADTLSLERIEEYYKVQCAENDFKGSFKEFIKNYGLDMEMWLIKNKDKLDLNVKHILINICW